MPAKKQINLFPKKAFTKSAGGKFLQWALTYGRYIIVGTEIIVLLAFVSRFKLDRDLTDLREEISQKQAIVEANRDFENNVRSIQNRLSQIAHLDKDQKQAIKLLKKTEQMTPTEVFFNSLTLTDTALTLSVNTFSPTGLTLFINNLKKSQLFTEITVNNLKQQSGEISFTLSANIITGKD